MIDQVSHLADQVVVVGSGLSGLITALMLAPEPVVLVTGGTPGEESASRWAQGGIAAALGNDDSVDLHLGDTLAAGSGLCDLKVANSILEAASKAVTTLERLGVYFDKIDNGGFALGLEAAHSRRRILHVAGDASGSAIIKALVAAVSRTPSITVVPHVQARRLLVIDGAVAGLMCACRGRACVIRTTRLVLATGGIGGLYDATTNPAGNWGQGIMLAARAGAMLADMEFVQFHPTALDISERPLPLISEAVRGEGAILVNQDGERFLSDQQGAELASRDIVARAVSAEISCGRRVYLDARQALGDRFCHRFPSIDAVCRRTGFDPSRDLIPVRPAAHYHMGGVATDINGRSSLEGLWAVGEVASTGLHGGNRLASNSLLEATVMGIQAAQDIAGASTTRRLALPSWKFPSDPEVSDVRSLVSQHLGVMRSAGSIHCAVAGLLPLVEAEGSPSDPAIVALLIAVFASLRKETRGAHARNDFPGTLKNPQRMKMCLADALRVAQSNISAPIARIA